MKRYLFIGVLSILLGLLPSCSDGNTPTHMPEMKDIAFIPTIAHYSFASDDILAVDVRYTSKIQPRENILHNFEIVSEDIKTSNFYLSTKAENIHGTEYDIYSVYFEMELPHAGEYSFSKVRYNIGGTVYENNVGEYTISFYEESKDSHNISLEDFTIGATVFGRYSAELTNEGDNLVVDNMLIGGISKFYDTKVVTFGETYARNGFNTFDESDDMEIEENQTRGVLIHFQPKEEWKGYVLLKPAIQYSRNGTQGIYPLESAVFDPQLSSEDFLELMRE